MLWLSALAAAGRPVQADPGPAHRVLTELLTRWREPHRRYHDLEHLQEVLAALVLLGAGPAERPAAVLAAWFHDAVYRGRAGADEQDSAALAQDRLVELDLPPAVGAEVARLVLLTLGHRPEPSDADGSALCDADLAVLGAPWPRYLRYARDVEAEYGHLPAEQFRAGRCRVLSELLERPRLYLSEAAHRRWDAAARANLRRELVLRAAG